MKRMIALLLSSVLLIVLAGCNGAEQQASSEPAQTPDQGIVEPAESTLFDIAPPEDFILINGGTFQMGSPETEAWRVEDETAHTVILSDYYISKFEVTQADYQATLTLRTG